MQYNLHIWYYRRYIMLRAINFQYYMSGMLRMITTIGN